MSLKFNRGEAVLRELVSRLEFIGDWSQLNPNQLQFRCETGAILNWFPSTGSLTFQGKAEPRDEMAEKVAESLKQRSVEVSKEPVKPVMEAATDEKVVFNRNQPTEIVIGIVGPMGTQNVKVTDVIAARLKSYGYTTERIRISKDIIPALAAAEVPENDEFARTNKLIELGNQLRKDSGNNGILALAAAAKISELRKTDEKGEPEVRKTAYIISSLKHPAEVAELRQIYPRGFYLFAVHSDLERRLAFLTKDELMSPENADLLIRTDEEEEAKHGQHTRDTFHLADFFIYDENNEDKFKNSVWRILNLIFGCPTITPTFDEYAMFMAYTASLRSADLSRQVGAVVARRNEIISTGGNDCPKFGGGLYWPAFSLEDNEIADESDGRDYKRGFDSNAVEKAKIIESVIKILPAGVDPEPVRKSLKSSEIKDITGYGRVVHAEMEAILSCSRNTVSCRDATLYCTTFPCHNCAKHIIAAGIKKVVFIEPYPKSKALDFHSDAIQLGTEVAENYVNFRPFIGVGPRQFFDLFSMTLSSGYALRRKEDNGNVVDWKPDESSIRLKMSPLSYIDLEAGAATIVESFLKGAKK